MRKEKILNKKTEKFILFLICIFMLIFILLYELGKLKQPYFTDEIGYWAAGAWFSGIDWSSVMSKNGYYGYGYGLLLAPLFQLDNPEIMFYGAIIINIMMVLVTFFIIYFILKEIFEENDYKRIILASFISCCYPYIIVYVHLTMCEICLTMFSAIYIYLMILLSKKITLMRTLFLAAIVGTLISIHLRTLIFVVISFLYFCILVCTRKIKIKDFLLIMIAVGIAVALAMCGKNLIIDNLYTDSITLVHKDHNDNISKKIGNINAYLNLRFIKNYIMCLGAKIFYLSISTFFLFDIAVWNLIKGLKNAIRENENVKIKKYIFLLLMLGIWILYSAFISGKTKITRTDMLMYGRYIENIVPLFIALGVVWVDCTKKTRNILMYSVCGSLMLGKLCYDYLQELGLNGLFPSMLPMQVCGLVGIPGIKNMDKALGITLYAVLCSCLIILLVYFLFRGIKEAAFMVVVGVWFTIAYSGMNDYVYNTYETIKVEENTKLAQFEIISEVAMYLRELEGDEIYYINEVDETGNASYFQMYDLQYDLVDRILTVVNFEKFKKLPSKAIVVVNRYEENFEIIKNSVKIIFENQFFVVGYK